MFNCEESSCENVQSVICLHCNHRLCIYHIGEHQKILLNTTDEFRNGVVNQVNIVLVNASNVMMEECTNEVKQLIHWRLMKIADIERDFKLKMNSIENHQKMLEEMKLELHQRMEIEVQQPLEHMLEQRSINPQLLDNIQSTIETIKKDSECLTWNLKHSDTVRQDAQRSQVTTISTEKKAKPWKPQVWLSKYFRDISPTSRNQIHEYVLIMKHENAIEHHGLITLIFSYLQAWHRTKANQGKYKEYVLSKHIITVRRYITETDCHRKVLIALQFFFNTLKSKGSKENEMMTMLLHFFFNHQCISIPEMINWYLHENFVDKSVGKKVNKKWAEPFLNLHGYSIESTDSTSEDLQEDSNTSDSETREHIHIRRPFKNLVKFLKDLSNTNESGIHRYIKKQYRRSPDRVIMIVRSYLQAWRESVSHNKTACLLNKISIIQYYKSDENFEMQILYAIEIFLSENNLNENWSIETATTLFQFFLDRDCIKKESFLLWYFDGHIYHQVYYQKTKGFVQSFIQRLIASD